MTKKHAFAPITAVLKLIDRFVRLGEPGLSTDEAARLRAARLHTVFRNTPWMMGANIANALLTMAVFWQSEAFFAAQVWAGCVIFLASFVLWSWSRHRKTAAPVRASIRGIRKATIYAAVLSSLWGLQAAYFFPTASNHEQLVIVAITVGMVTGGGIALATVPSASISFTAMIGIGSAIALVREQELVGLNLLLLYVVYFTIATKACLSISRGMGERVRSQLAMREQRDVISMLLNDFEESGSDWLWGVDRDLKLLRASPRFFELIGTEPSSTIGQPFWDVLPFQGGGCSVVSKSRHDRLKQAMQLRQPFRDLEICCDHDGEQLIWSLSAKPIYDENDDFMGYRGVGRDVTAARQARQRIEHLAKHDPLTEIGNRTLLSEELELALHRQRRYDDGFSLLLLDLDHFKRVNDTHGHAAGDMLLQSVTKRLMALLSGADTLARLGGDEFAIIHTSAESPNQTRDLADKITRSLSEPFEIGGVAARIGVSIGIACAPLDGTDGDLLMRNADLALYRAKSEGRSRYRFFDKSLDEASRRRNLLEHELRQAVSENGLSLNFQPLVDSATGKVVCFEALLRWHHPTLGTIGPAEFIPIAEDCGIIIDIGSWTVREALKIASGWPDHVRVAVNLSPRQFTSPTLFATVQDAIRHHDFAHDRLELEVTESLLLEACETVEATLRAFRALGIRIALDDFGTGYSSLSYLREYRFDKLKIDQSFIRDIETSQESRAIVEAIIRLGQDLQLSLVAEGVETEGQFAALNAMGCEQIQGFLIGRARPNGELDQYLNGSFAAETERKRA